MPSTTSSEWSAPPYVDAALAEWLRPGAQPPPIEDAFLHLGHWDHPTPKRPPRASLLAAQRRLDDVMIDWATVGEDDRVLDVGCGIGATLARLERRRPGAELWGLNRDPVQIACAKRYLGASRVHWSVGDACAMPFERGCFDRVLAIECVFHFDSRAAFFAEAARVLVPGGALVTSDFAPTPAGHALRRDRAASERLRGALAGLGDFPDPLGSEGDPTDLAARAGLHLERREDATAAVRPSFACLLPEPRRRGSSDPLERALRTLAVLCARGILAMEYRRYAR